MDDAHNDTALHSFEDLLRPFVEAIKPASARRIGAEAEKFGVDALTGAPVAYDGPRSVSSVFEALVQRGWSRVSERPGGPTIALTRDNASVTLEPGCQLELSGAPFASVHAIAAETRHHLDELRDLSTDLGLVWLGVGFHPLARLSELPMVPKARYSIMKNYLPTRGTSGVEMMFRTATVQANFDYSSEEEAMRMLNIALRISPIVTAMFANSPFVEGRAFGGKSYRARVWLDVDPSRQGLLPSVLSGQRRFADYVEWALDAPMFLIKRGAEVLENTGQTFRVFMKEGLRGHRATHADWELHLNTMFPEVRLKRTIEVRGADSLPAGLSSAVPALWTGILYDQKSLDEADDLSREFSFEELQALRSQVAISGLGALFRGQRVAHFAERLIASASEGLRRRSVLDACGNDEREHLKEIAALVQKGRCPADELLDGLDVESPGLRAEILKRARVDR